MTRTVVALYQDLDTAQDVVVELLDAGFTRDSISLVANDAGGTYAGRYGNDVNTIDVDEEDVKPGEGAGFGAVVGALVGLGVALIPGIGPVLAAGPLAAALMAGIGAVTGAVTGGVVASLVDFGIPEEEAHVYAESLRRGATLVSVTTDDSASARAEDILNRHRPLDVEHRSEYYHEAGWNEFDHEGQPYSVKDVETDHVTYHTYSSRPVTVDDYEATTPSVPGPTYPESNTIPSSGSLNNTEIGDSVHSGAAGNPAMTGAGTGAGDLVSNAPTTKGVDDDDDTWDGSEATPLRQGGARSYSSKP